MIVFKFLPLFAVLLVGFWGMHHLGYFPDKLNVVPINICLPSGAIWKPTWGDMVVLLGLITLYIEIFKSTRTTSISIVDHTLSTIVFVAYLVSWMIFPWTIGDKSNSVFLFLALMSFIDVIAGFTITIAAARRDMSFGGN
jgi:hypothetical protein